jgi:hypothetical protein
VTPKLHPLGLLGRVVGVSAFVWLLPPFGILTLLVSSDEQQMPAAVFFIALILLACAHLYLFNRAYYALRTNGILVFTIVYMLLAYFIMVFFKIEVSILNARWNAAAYLTLLYSYGLCYNFVDSFLSGLLHTKSV